MGTRRAATFLVVALLSGACGARLTQEQRLAAVSQGGIRGTSGSGSLDEAGSELTSGVEGGTEASLAGGAGGSGGAASGGAGPGGGLNAAAPAGGNGGATDVGVTATQITIANLSDISGPSPGLFKTAQQAMAALTAYANNEGGLYGRKLKLNLIDSKTDAGANNAGALDACANAFALVGSMSAFDDGGAQTIDKCGIPDLSAIPVNAARQLAKNTYGAFPNRPDMIAVGQANYIKEKNPDASKKAAIFWLNGAVTRSQAMRVVETWESVGFSFHDANGNLRGYETQAVEPNYCPYVVSMRNQGVDYVTSVSDYQSIVRFLQAIRQCGGGWNPKVKDWNSVIYSPGFIKLAGQDAEDSLVYLNTALFEERANNPEMQLYLKWLNKVAPGAEPDYFGLYAWSAGRLFLKAAQAAGPKLTRAALFEQIRKIHDWTSNGLHAPQDVGSKVPTTCFLYAKVSGGKFTRLEPAGGGFSCDRGGLYKPSQTFA